jgi:hypothetical protein
VTPFFCPYPKEQYFHQRKRAGNKVPPFSTVISFPISGLFRLLADVSKDTAVNIEDVTVYSV